MAVARTKVMEAVEQLNFRVTVGDIAASTGIALPDVQQELMTLARDADGHMQVSDQGEIAYAFDQRFRKTIERKLRQDRGAVFRQKLWQALLYGLRLSFGILMLVEFSIIVVAIIALLVASRGENNDQRDDRRDGGFSFFPMLWLGNPFWAPVHYDNYGRPQPRKPAEKAKTNFLESVYSFLFGDGDPGAELEENRSKLIARTIRNHGGVIAGEQVLPYLEVAADAPALEYEDYMLPVLVKFNGQPEVSDQGEIVYRFPELQVVASDRQKLQVAQALEEQPWKFSKATSGQLTLAMFFGLANFLGAWFLYLFIRPEQWVAAGVAFISPLLGLLVIYGTLFLAVPGIRWLVLQRRNRNVDKRNILRQSWLNRLQDPSEKLLQKLTFARRFARQDIVNPEDTIYSTDKNLIEQRDYELDRPAFQHLLEGNQEKTNTPELHPS